MLIKCQSCEFALVIISKGLNMTQLGCKRFFSPKFQVNRWMRCQSQFHTPVLAPEPGFCVTKPGCKLFLLFQIKTNLFPKYLQVLLKQRLPNHTYLNWNASKTGTKFWFNNVPLYSNGSIYIDTLASNLSPYTTKVLGLLSGFWWGFWRGRFKKQQLFVNSQTWKDAAITGFCFI